MELPLGFSAFVLLMIAVHVVTGVDEAGYIVFCPCMGRFGNQVEHYLGTLSFAKRLGRTLVLPPFIHYRHESNLPNLHIPFTELFNIEKIKSYHSVIPMETFMADVAVEAWPVDKRTAYCHKIQLIEGLCNINGNPFGVFWDHFNVNFTHGYPINISYLDSASTWNKQYPPNEGHLVLALGGAPASFPMHKDDRHLQKYLAWTDQKLGAARSMLTAMYKEANVADGAPYLGIHIRHGSDWARACPEIRSDDLYKNQFMASPQCTDRGIQVDFGSCLPSMDTIQSNINDVLRRHRLTVVYVATDSGAEDLVTSLELRLPGVTFIWSEQGDPYMDLVLLGLADHFIGNCVSSYSAFVVRERDVHGNPVSFWGTERKTEL